MLVVKKLEENENTLIKLKMEVDSLFIVPKNRNVQILNLMPVQKIKNGIIGGIRRSPNSEFGLSSSKSQ